MTADGGTGAGSTMDSNSKGKEKMCAGCAKSIEDPFLFTILGVFWHQQCVVCSDCKTQLNDTCYYKSGQFYCREDYFRHFGEQCVVCKKGFQPMDQGYYAWGKAYHLDCFKCADCNKEVIPGDSIYALDQIRFICEDDHKCRNLKVPEGPALTESRSKSQQSDSSVAAGEEQADCMSSADSVKEASLDEEDCGDSEQALMSPTVTEFCIDTECNGRDDVHSPANSTDEPITGATAANSNGENSSEKEEGMSEEGSSGSKRRGPRTTIKPNQLEMLVAAFSDTSKPGRSVREKLSQETGLTMRVIQVWFQNRRSKERRLNNNSMARRPYLPNRPPRSRRSQGSEMDSPELGPHYNSYGYSHDGQRDYYPSYGSYPQPDFYSAPMAAHPTEGAAVQSAGYIPQGQGQDPTLDSSVFLPNELSPHNMMSPSDHLMSHVTSSTPASLTLHNPSNRYTAPATMSSMATAAPYASVNRHHQPIESW